MKSNKAKAVYISMGITIMFVTVFAVISLSYAWYNEIFSADITSINMTTSQSGGILLSGNGTDWSSTLTTDGGIASINIDQNLEINSISTGGEVIDGDMQFYSGSFTNDSFNTTLLTEANLYYVFDMYVLNYETIAKRLTLGRNSSVTDTNGKDVELSIRVAFLNLGSSSDPATATAFDGTGITDIDFLWEPNSTVRNSRIDVYRTTYLEEGKVGYEGVDRAATDVTLTENIIVDTLGTPELEVVDVTTVDPVYAGDSSDITTLTADAITKLRVYIWSEGQDIDSTNSISGGTADLNFNFNSYDLTFQDPDYVATEKYNTPSLTNTAGVNYTWSATDTTLSATTFSSEYMFRIKKDISGTMTTIRTVYTTGTSINVDDLADLELGQYYVELKVYTEEYAHSDYSSTLTFDVLDVPTNYAITTDTISWDTLTNASSYTVWAYDQSTDTSYYKTITGLSLDLSTALFDGDVTLPSGKQYTVSIKANGDLGYANSKYSTTLNWLS